MAQHKNLTGSDLHEPKGIATAAAGQTYVADGAGSGAWSSPGGAVYGELQVSGNTTSIAIPQAAVDLDTNSDYVKINGGIWSNGEASGVTLDAANGKMTISVAGLYEISMWASFTADVVNSVTAFKYSTDDTNATLSTRRLTRKSGSSTDVGCIAASGFVELAAGAKLSLWAATDLTGVDITIYDAGVTATLLRAS